MKRIICVLLSLIMLCGCGKKEQTPPKRQGEYIKGVWLSFSEIDSFLSGDFETRFEVVLRNLKKGGITDLYAHIRPYCDSYYPSKLFPLRASVQGKSADIVEYMVRRCHENGIRIHGWINPYRVRTADADISALPSDSPAYTWLNNDDKTDDTNVCFANGIYLNPASDAARRLCVEGVKEMLGRYDFDGIHLDDYFYPTTDPAFDKVSFNGYCAATAEPLSLEDWRRENVNALVSSLYTAVKSAGEDKIFSISPAAGIAKNKYELYADVKAWCDGGYIDYIIPQLYFGFEYPDYSYRFELLLKGWKDLAGDTKLIIGLAAYKIGTAQEADRAEWSDPEVLKRQAKLCFEDISLSGHIYFSYTAYATYVI